MSQQTTRLPSGMNEESAIISTELFSLTLRQVAAVIGGLFLCYLSAEILNNFLPGAIAWLLALPILVVGLGVAFVKRRGSHLDDYFADRIRFMIEPRTYVNSDPDSTSSIDVDWREVR